MEALYPLAGSAVSGASPQEQGLTITGKPCCYALFTACLYVCLSLLVRGQYDATWGKYTMLRWSGGGHHAAELGCGRLRRCPVIRPATNRGCEPCMTGAALWLRHTGAGACLSLANSYARSCTIARESCVEHSALREKAGTSCILFKFPI